MTQTKNKTMSGVVLRRSGEKTVSVEVTRVIRHPLYRKYLRHRKRYLVHDPANSAVVGETVTIQSMRPLSRRKRWMIVRAQD
jgi:small subunit ribosomal protein S17